MGSLFQIFSTATEKATEKAKEKATEKATEKARRLSLVLRTKKL